MLNKTAFVSGCSGQDGALMSKLLLKKGYKVVALKRRTSIINTSRIDDIINEPNFKMEYFELNDSSCIYHLLNKYQPREFYHFAAPSHVRVSFDIPENAIDSIILGTLRILNAIKEVSPHTKLLNAASSEIFGDALCPAEGYNENSLKQPASPYAAAKLAALHLCQNYRTAYSLFICSSISFNHEEPGSRGETFVSRKISMAAAKIKYGKQNKLTLGNLEAKRDWGLASETVEACHLMLQERRPDDYVIATGQSHSVKDFLTIAFEYVGLGDYKKYIDFDEKYLRPQEVPFLKGNANKAKNILGWQPKTSFEQLVKMMCDADLEREKI